MDEKEIVFAPINQAKTITVDSLVLKAPNGEIIIKYERDTDGSSKV